MKFGVGQPVSRTEDPRFLKGEGRYVDDIVLPRQVHGYVLRSPHAAAAIRSIDVDAARNSPGVLLVLTRAEIEEEGIDGIPHFIPPMAFGAPLPGFSPLHPILAGDRVRHVGTPVAFVVADTLDLAMDAAERIEVDYEVLPSVTAPGRATEEDAPAVWDEAPDNIWFTLERGDKAATDAAFERAAHVTRLSLTNNRLSCNAMEPRATIVDYAPATDHATMYTENQSPHAQRGHLSHVFHKPEANFRVISPDVGGGFGMKNAVYPEDALCVIAARRLKRPVRWTADRAESLQSDAHARDAVTEAELALDADGRFLAMRATTDHAVGAYLGEAACVPVGLGSTMYAGNYDLPAAYLSVDRGVHQHQHDRPVSRRRAAGGLLHRRTAGRPGCRRARYRSRRAQAAQLHQAGRHAVPDRDHDGLRLGRVREDRRHGGETRGPRRVRGPQGGIRGRRQAARPRHHLFHRDRSALQRPDGALFRPGRRGDRRRWHPQPRPGAPDGLRADGLGVAGRAVRERPPGAGRYRPRGLWARHLRLAFRHHRGGRR